MNRELLTVRQAAQILNVSPKTIRKWAQLKKLKGMKIGTRGDWRFTKEELLKLIRHADK
jgi:excisionase family DNA binding protein